MFDVCYRHEVTDRETGETKTYWPRVGVAFQNNENQRVTIKMNSLPLSSLWDGTIYLFPRDQTDYSKSENRSSYSQPDLPF